MTEMSSTLTAESKKYAAVAKDLHRQASNLPALCFRQFSILMTATDFDPSDTVWPPTCGTSINLLYLGHPLCYKLHVELIWLWYAAGFDTKIHAHSCHPWNSAVIMVGQEVLLFPDWLTLQPYLLHIYQVICFHTLLYQVAANL